MSNVGWERRKGKEREGKQGKQSKADYSFMCEVGDEQGRDTDSSLDYPPKEIT